MQIPHILHPILNYKRVESKDYVIAFVRNELCSALTNADVKTFNRFCNEVVHLQDFRYKLNNTIGCESEDVIPLFHRHEFHKVIYDDTAPLDFLLKNLHRFNDPGVIVYGSFKAKNSKQDLVQKISSMSDTEFKNFIDQIACIEYFACLQNKSYFSWNRHAIDLDDENFWFIDEDFLNDEDDVPNII